MKRFKLDVGRQYVYASYDRLLGGWNVAYTEQDIHTTYGTTHIITAGSPDRPPLLLLHGTADNSALMWIYNARELSNHYFLLLLIISEGREKANPMASMLSLSTKPSGWTRSSNP
ncbi:hypothetical protein JCM10914A_01910 [Paenibacillus sp. JCM 10914]|uniref:alpha/beta fold hydrolase n=1 Tax=Paenibacillus sp. JCM 10914 TaxID=1236974 RepID=UPI0003CC9F6F|nr:hypothetical protein [Paenibacillus sp. JCM 10914]GAE06878.1 hypothetical protein JCM10914_3065 [Paenibacillus sp. JCM 10914]